MIVSVEGANLHYTTRGEGPVCLVLSAIGTPPYERMIPAPLSERWKVVFVDLRGGGRSTGDPADLSFDRLAADLEAIRVDLGAERVAVLGHSILGMLALEYGRRCPASVSPVISVGTPPFGDMARVSQAGTVFFEADAAEERKAILRENLAGLGEGAPLGAALFAQTPLRFFDPRFDAAALYAEARAEPRLLQQLFGPLGQAWDVTADPGSLRVPILHVHGRYDYVVPYTLWDGILAQLPDARLELFERSGHHPFCEEPERFVAVLDSWAEALER